MSKVVVDEGLRARLNATDSFVELCGEDGQTVGFFVKADTHAQFLSVWATFEVTADELNAARQEYRERGGHTLAEVYAELRRRGIPGVPAE
jgi:hypothetical protein